MKFTVTYPAIPSEVFPEGMGEKKIVRSFVLEAIRKGLEPIPLPEDDLKKSSVDFSPAEAREVQRAISSFTENKHLTPGHMLGAFCQAEIKALMAEKQADSIKIFESSIQLRSEQKKFLDNLLPGLRKGGIVLCEGATGIGKGLALAIAAAAVVKEGRGPVVSVSPSLGVLSQNVQEFLRLDDQERRDIRPRIVLGRTSFFDPELALLFLSDPDSGIPQEQAQASSKWILEGAKPLPGSPTETIRRFCPSAAFLLDDLAAIAPQIADIEGIALEEGIGGLAEEVYQELRQECLDGDLIFATHAMLVADMRLRRSLGQGVFPDFKTLLVDEAHLLADITAQIETLTFSPIIMRATLRRAEGIGTKATREKIIKTCTRMVETGGVVDKNSMVIWPRDYQNQTYPQEATPLILLLRDIARDLEGLVKNKGFGKSATANYLITMRNTLNSMLAFKKRGVKIDLSPVRRWPSFTSGPTSVEKTLGAFWDQAELGVGLVSATLYLPGPYGEVTPAHMVKTLAIPQQRLCTSLPVIPSWVTSPVTLHIPEKPKAFIPPAEKEFESAEQFQTGLDIWHERVAHAIETIAAKASGGTLVLLTSFESVREIQKRLSESKEAGSRLIVQTRDSRFSLLRESFIEKAKKGKRPVWLAVGQGWTGLDLSHPEKMASEDEVLTDLVIPRIPFRAPGTSMIRGKDPKSEAAFAFRQGCGRLVRRPGCRGKNLWVLDGRIWEGDGRFYQVFRSILSRYDMQVREFLPV